MVPKKAQKIIFLSFKTGEKLFWRHFYRFFMSFKKLAFCPQAVILHILKLLCDKSDHFLVVYFILIDSSDSSSNITLIFNLYPPNDQEWSWPQSHPLES